MSDVRLASNLIGFEDQNAESNQELKHAKFEDQGISKSSNEFNTISNEASAQNRNSILQSYDYLLNNKYKVEVNEKTLDRIKNYFR